MPARMAPASREGQLAQFGVGDCLRFAVGDEHPDEGHAVGANSAKLPLCCKNAVCMDTKMHGAGASC